MARHAPLPAALDGWPFSVAQARAAGVSPRRLRGSDLSAPFHGVRAAAPAKSVAELAAAYAPRMRPGHVFAGVTAARLWGLPVQSRWRSSEPLVIGVPAGTSRTRARGVVTREFDAAKIGVGELDGLPILGPLGTVLMFARRSQHADLVVLIEALITSSERYPDLRLPARPHSSIAALTAFSAACRGMHGAAALRAALLDVRSGADSPGETRSRLAIVAAGLPEPVVQHEVWLDGVLQAVLDLAYPEWMIDIEYEGEHHLTDPAQWAKDIRRQELLESLGWIVIRVTKGDHRDGGRSLVRRVRAALARRGIAT